jgi:cytochrome c biogenesis protein CcmG/thiol:disulfide interchange protein DsbE
MPTTRSVLTAAGVALAALPLLAMAPRVAREGDGAHREKMSELEAKPFPADAMKGLTEWAGGDAISPELFGEGGVVVFAYIDSTNGASMTMLNRMTRLERENADKGLRVFAVHAEENWDKLESLAADNRVRVPVAKDTGGAFKAAMGIDDDPDVYLIDRAGLLRYADVESRAVESTVTWLLRETPESALAAAKAEASTRREAMKEDGSAEERTAVRTAAPATTEQYASAKWPEHNAGSLNATNVQGKRLPVALGNEAWLTEQQDLSGKVIVLDFWATWCGPCIRAMPSLDSLQKSYPRDIAVLGVGGQGEDRATVEKFLKSNRHSYGQLFDGNQRVYRSLGVRAIPHVVVLSSDGVVRWQGNPLDSKFRQAVDAVIRADPGLARNQNAG